MRLLGQADLSPCSHFCIATILGRCSQREIRQAVKDLTQHSPARCLKLTPLQASHLTHALYRHPGMPGRKPQPPRRAGCRVDSSRRKVDALKPQLCASYPGVPCLRVALRHNFGPSMIGVAMADTGRRPRIPGSAMTDKLHHPGLLACRPRRFGHGNCLPHWPTKISYSVGVYPH